MGDTSGVPLPVGLLGQPFVFTQDKLLDAQAFVKAARARGRPLDVGLLRAWHDAGWLPPLLLLVDEPDPQCVISPPAGRLIGANLAGDAVAAAAAGRLRDGASAVSGAAPYLRTVGGPIRSPWMFSSWQLLELRGLPPDVERVSAGPDAAAARSGARRRARTVVLCDFASWALPSFMGRVQLPDGHDSFEAWQDHARAAEPARVIAAVGWSAADLREEAEQLLLDAHWDDPVRDWWPLVRRMRPDAWHRARGLALDAIDRRIAAEVLLQGYEVLAKSGMADLLPDPSPRQAWHMLDDRLSSGSDEPLDSVLAQYGLSPHPRVLLLVEGETEEWLARALCAEASPDPGWVRVSPIRGKRDPKLLTTYVTAPVVRRRDPDGMWALTRPPTACYVHVDPENKWATDADAEKQRNAIVSEIVADVARQGANVDEDDLESLIHVDLAPERGFELSNFSNEELADALLTLTPRSLERDQVLEHLSDVRARQANFVEVAGPLRVTKMQLAKALLAVLMEDLAAIEPMRPLPRAVVRAVRVAMELPTGTVVLRPAPPGGGDAAN